MQRSFFLAALTALVLPLAGLMADQIILDSVMSREEQKKTGVDKMTMQQKIELEAWLNKTFILKTTDTSSQTQLSMSINIDNGQKLQLSDNTIWEIAPGDVPTAAVWITPFPVKITPSNDPDYPSLLVNTTSGVSVKARKISPSSPAAQPGQSAPAQ
ncbi:MAG: hypothetical protein JSS60_09060 [Verrucomicrobia bacterium]|nr:hypothetical protein [Verrucomicrobiota bacterium]